MCPRCGSNDTVKKTIYYADGPMESERCLDCAYLDVKRPPTYISPLTADAASGGRRDPRTGRVFPEQDQTEIV